MASMQLALRTLWPRSCVPSTTAEALLGSVTRAQRLLLAAAGSARLAMEILPLAKPYLVGLMVDRLAGKASLESLWIPLAGLFAFALLSALAAMGYGLASARLGLATVGSVRSALIASWAGHGLGGLSVGDALTRSGRDVDRLRAFTDRVFVRSFTGWARGLLPGVVLLLASAPLALVALVVLPIQSFILGRLEKRLEAAAHRASRAHAALYDSLEVFFRAPEETGAREVVEQRGAELEDAELASRRLEASVKAWALLCTGTGVGLVWAGGSYQVTAGTMSLGELVSFAGYVTLAYRPFRQLAAVSKTYRTGLASLERVAEALDRAKSPSFAAKTVGG